LFPDWNRGAVQWSFPHGLIVIAGGNPPGGFMDDLLSDVAHRAFEYLTSVPGRSVVPRPKDLERLAMLGGSVPETSTSPSEVLRLLDEIGSPATVTSTGGRYFGFVTGGTLPAALAANWLAGAWDQNAAFAVMSPVAAAIEEIVLGWLRELLGLPLSCGAGFVTGATTANFTCLAAARGALLHRAGWDVEDQGLFGAPTLNVVVGGGVHASLLKALSMLGLGKARVITVPADEQGRMRSDSLPVLDERTIVCLQAGNVNSGAFDPAEEICSRARDRGAWVHVDGAFGLWAAVAPERAHLTRGFSKANSWATDCHKWLNVPYDSGVAFVRQAEDLRNAMSLSASYLQIGTKREASHYTPESSRRARGVEIWAALKSLGRSGLAGMIEQNCRLATRFANGLSAAGYEVLNDVVLNQVLASFGDSDLNKKIVGEVQRDGTCWCGGTEWQKNFVMRISVSCWATIENDIDRSVAAVVRIAKAVQR
jgi:glutamate/tyrosine decarboxylase-like PLP-dependent enzyme